MELSWQFIVVTVLAILVLVGILAMWLIYFKGGEKSMSLQKAQSECQNLCSLEASWFSKTTSTSHENSLYCKWKAKVAGYGDTNCTTIVPCNVCNAEGICGQIECDGSTARLR